jgi:hypothetical protein
VDWRRGSNDRALGAPARPLLANQFLAYPQF